MEAVKNRLTSFGRNAGPFVVNPDADFVAHARDGNFDEAAGRRETHRIVDDRVDCSGEAIRLAHDDRRALARASEGEAGIAGLAAGLPAMHELLDERPEIDFLEPSAG